MATAGRGSTVGRVRVTLALICLGAGTAAAQTGERGGALWLGARTGALWLHATDEAASPLRYGGTVMPLELALGHSGAGAWEVALQFRQATLSRLGNAPGSSADDRHVALRAGWDHRLTGGPSSLALRLGAAAEARAGLRTQQYAWGPRRFPHYLVAVGPQAALELARGRELYRARLGVPALALVQQAYGADVQAPWRVRGPGRTLRGGRLALEWAHPLGTRWRALLGWHSELLRVGDAPVLAQTAHGVTLGVTFEPGRRP